MTSEQFNRWRDFSLRMARACFRNARRPNATWIVGVVKEFFDEFEMDDVCCIVSWDNSDPYPEWHPRRALRRNGRSWENPICIGDAVDYFLQPLRGYAPSCLACRSYGVHADCRCDEIADLYHDTWDDQWGGPIRCCLRAGLDCASSPSAGVIGFTAGDVRHMYPEGVPEWVFPADERLHYWMTDDLNGTFAELPDSAGLVL